jgi:hypothetical protein
LEGEGVNAQANPGIDFATAQNGYHANAAARREARIELRDRLVEKARADHSYRTQLSLDFAKHRADGKGVGESEILAKGGKASLAALERDLADAKAKAAAARLAELEGERASLRQLVDWTREES